MSSPNRIIYVGRNLWNGLKYRTQHMQRKQIYIQICKRHVIILQKIEKDLNTGNGHF